MVSFPLRGHYNFVGYVSLGPDVAGDARQGRHLSRHPTKTAGQRWNILELMAF
jgi:hypothetical protein